MSTLFSEFDTFDQPQAESGKPKVWKEGWNLQSNSYYRSYGNETINTGLVWASRSLSGMVFLLYFAEG